MKCVDKNLDMIKEKFTIFLFFKLLWACFMGENSGVMDWNRKKVTKMKMSYSVKGLDFEVTDRLIDYL